MLETPLTCFATVVRRGMSEAGPGKKREILFGLRFIDFAKEGRQPWDNAVDIAETLHAQRFKLAS